MTAPEPRVMPRDVLREALKQAVMALPEYGVRLSWDSLPWDRVPTVRRLRVLDAIDEVFAAVPSESDPPKGYEPVIWLGSGEPISGSVAAYKALHPFGPICGMTVAGGPNGEPLACAYPQNPPDEPMHAHSWATLPTFVQGRAVPSESDARLDAPDVQVQGLLEALSNLSRFATNTGDYVDIEDVLDTVLLWSHPFPARP